MRKRYSALKINTVAALLFTLCISNSHSVVTMGDARNSTELLEPSDSAGIINATIALTPQDFLFREPNPFGSLQLLGDVLPPTPLGTKYDITTWGENPALPYDSWPGLAWSSQLDQWVVLSVRSSVHGALDGDIRIYHSDGVEGKTWSYTGNVTLMPGWFGQGTRLVTSGNRLYASIRKGQGNTYGHEIHESLDGGRTWTFLSEINPALQSRSESRPIYHDGVWLLGCHENSPSNYGVAVYESSNGMHSWVKRSDVFEGGFAGFPNENALFAYKGDLVMIYRNADFGASPIGTPFGRVASSDGGLTWGSPIAVNIPAVNNITATGARPAVLMTTDGRLILSTRNLFSSQFITASNDGGITWAPSQYLDGDVDLDNEYTAFYQCDDGLLAMVRGTEERPGVNSKLDFSFVDFQQKPNQVPLSTFATTNTALAWKASDNYESLIGPDPVQGLGADTTVVRGEDGYAGLPAVRSNGVDERLEWGTVNDWNFLHDGSPFTIGFLMTWREVDANSFPLGTCHPTDSEVGIYIGDSVNRIRMGVKNSLVDETLITKDSPIRLGIHRVWDNVVIQYDEMDYRMWVNGVEQDDSDPFPLPPDGVFTNLPSSDPFYFGRSDSSGKPHTLRSLFITGEVLTDTSLSQLIRWLEAE